MAVFDIENFDVVKNDRFCAVGVLGKYNIYKGECGSDTVLESNFDNF